MNLVGYCDEGDHLALIYEFMPNGDLKQHLSGDIFLVISRVELTHETQKIRMDRMILYVFR